MSRCRSSRDTAGAVDGGVRSIRTSGCSPASRRRCCRSFTERLLGPLAEYDARHNAELLPTLRSFLACDGSWSACAARMYVHVNTVRYRIGRIEALTGRDLSALADRVDFFLALRGA